MDRIKIALGLAFAGLLMGGGAASVAGKQASLQCTVILDVASGKALHREGECERRLSPASSFKLPLAVMGYDAGILTGKGAPRWPYKAEYDAPQRDHKDVDPTIWERDSVLWYSREITRRLGADKFAAYVRDFDYGNADVSGDGKNGLTHSWLSSSLQISADEQARFVLRLLRNELPVSPNAMDLSRSIIPAFKADGGWSVQGKTGSIWLRRASGKYDRSKPVGWFVGWATKGERRVAFASVTVGGKTEVRSGLAERERFLKALPSILADQ